MSLTATDLQEIRTIIRSEIAHLEDKIEIFDSKVEALIADVKKIYAMLSELQTKTITYSGYKKLSLEKKL